MKAIRFMEPEVIEYSAVATPEPKDNEVLAQIARNRKCVLKGDEPDIRKAAALLLDDFRSGRIGRITLESPTEQA